MSKATFIGVYSTMIQGPQEGRGAEKRKRYWFAWDCGDAGYRVQGLDGAFQPQGEALPVEAAAFRARFSPEPSILAAPIRQGVPPLLPSQPQEATPKPAAGDRAEVENFLRGHFGALLLRVRRGDDVAGSLKALQDIAEVEEGIVPEHKHMFAEFGINLRKGKLPEIALAHAKRVLSLAPDDSNAHFNIARIYHVLGKPTEAEQHLLTALEFAPDMEYAKAFLAYMSEERRQKERDARRTWRL